MKNSLAIWSLFASFFLGLPVLSHGSFVYEGHLSSQNSGEDGEPFSGSRLFTFIVLGWSSGACELFRESRNVEIRNGHFSVTVGGPGATSQIFHNGLTFQTIFSNQLMSGNGCTFDGRASSAKRFLEIIVEGESLGQMEMTQAPMATVSKSAESLQGQKVSSEIPSSGQILRWDGGSQSWTASNEQTTVASLESSKLIGTLPTSLLPAIGGDLSWPAGTSAPSVIALRGRSVATTAPVAQQVLKWNGSAWAPGEDLQGGTVTTVSTAAPLVVANPTTTPSLSLAAAGIQTSHLADGLITTAKIGNTQVTSDKISSVAVNKISSGSGLYLTYQPGGVACASGEILKYNGTNWICGTDASASLGDGTSSGQVPQWTGTTWAPSTVGTQLTALNATNITIGNLAAARLPTISGDLSLTGTTTATATVSGLQGRSVVNTAPASGQVLKWNGTSWAPAADLQGGSGTVTSVTATTPLAVSQGTTTPALSLVAGGIQTTHLADTSVTTAKISSLNVDKIASATGLYLTYRPAGTACADGQTLKWETTNSRWTCGNDLGTNLTSGTVTGQMLRWNGTAWAASTVGTQLTDLNANNITTGTLLPSRLPAFTGDLSVSMTSSVATTVTAIQGRQVLATAPASGNVLKWNGTAWAPAAESGSGGSFDINCPSGMTKVAGVLNEGLMPFCISSSTLNSQSSYINMLRNCVTNNAEICGVVELRRACASGAATTGSDYWTSTPTGDGGVARFNCNGTVYLVSGTSNVTSDHPYRCCRK